MAGQNIGTIFVELDLDASRYVGAQKRLLQDATATTLNIESNFKKLGVKSSAEFDLLRQRATNAFERIKNSNQVTANDIIRAEKAKTDQLKMLNEQQYGSHKSLLSRMKENWLATTAVITASIYAIRRAWDIVKLGAQAEQEMQSFKNMAASYGVNTDRLVADLKRASAGTVDVMTLVQKAGTAMMMGIDPEKISKLMEIARATSQMTGQTVTKAFEDISLAVGRQSKMILDNLGIIVRVDSANEAYAKTLNKSARELTDTEKKQAFLNATLQAGEVIMQRLGNQTKTTAEWFQSFGALTENIKVALGQGLLEVVKKMTIGFTWLGVAFNQTMADIAGFFSKDLEKHFKDAVQRSMDFIKELENLKAGATAPMKIGLGGVSDSSEIGGGADSGAAGGWKRDPGLIASKMEAEINAITEHNNKVIELEKELQARSIQQGTEAAEEKLRSYIEWSNQEINLEIQQNKRLEALDKQAYSSKVSIARGLGTALMGIVGANNQAIFIATQAFDAALAIISGHAAGAKALAEVPYPANLAVSAKMVSLGYWQAAAIAATAIGTLATSGSGSSGGGTYMSPTVTTSASITPIGTTQQEEKPEQKGIFNIYVDGDFIGDKEWVGNLAERISEMVENYDVTFIASHAQQLQDR